jgi:outer membrane autotransporter protein
MLRAGIKLGKVWKNSEFYISADLMQELDARSKVTVADVTFREEIDGCWAKFGLGTNMKINDKMVLYANVGTMLGNNKVKIPISYCVGKKKLEC